MKDVENIISQLEQQKTAIERAIEALRGISSGAVAVRRGRKAAVAAEPQSTTPGGRPPVSAEARMKLAEAMRKRWVAKRAGKKGTGAKKAAKTAAAKKITHRGPGKKVAAKTATRKRALKVAAPSATPEQG